MSDRDQRSEMVGIAVYPETKEEWQQAAEDDLDADTLSQFIRVAVNRYIYNRSNGPGDEISEEVHDQLTELNAQQEALGRRLNEITAQLSEIREAVVGAEILSDTEELANDIFDLLPSKQDVQTDAALSGDYDPGTVPAPEPGTVEWLSNRLEASRYKIQTALDHLDKTTYAVDQTDEGQYFKEAWPMSNLADDEMNQFLQRVRQTKSEGTYTTRKNALGRFSEWLEETNQTATELGAMDIEDFLISLSNKGYAPNSISGYYDGVRLFYNFLERSEVIEENPIESVDRSTIRSLTTGTKKHDQEGIYVTKN